MYIVKGWALNGFWDIWPFVKWMGWGRTPCLSIRMHLIISALEFGNWMVTSKHVQIQFVMFSFFFRFFLFLLLFLYFLRVCFAMHRLWNIQQQQKEKNYNKNHFIKYFLLLHVFKFSMLEVKSSKFLCEPYPKERINDSCKCSEVFHFFPVHSTNKVTE